MSEINGNGSTITLGLSVINVGESKTDGTVQATLGKIGKTYKDSCKIAMANADVTEHYEEGKSAPEVRKKNKKIPTLAFQLMNPDPAMLAAYVGGEVDQTTGAWGYSGDEIVTNKYIQVVTEQGLNFEIPNGDIEAAINGELSAKGIVVIDFTVTPCAVATGKAFRGVTKTKA
jgi:hypothetical protein